MIENEASCQPKISRDGCRGGVLDQELETPNTNHKCAKEHGTASGLRYCAAHMCGDACSETLWEMMEQEHGLGMVRSAATHMG